MIYFFYFFISKKDLIYSQNFTLMSSFLPAGSGRLALGAGGQEGDEAAGEADAERVVDVGRGAGQDVEGRKDHEGKEQRVVVEDREGGGLVLSNLPRQPMSRGA